MPVLRHLSLAAAVCALLFVVAGYFGPSAVDKALHKGILENIVWRPDSPPDVDARFRGQPADPDAVPDYFRIWLWNITNLPEVRQGAKPKMVEVGPLTYVKSRVRLDPRWDRSGRVAVKEWDYHVFQPALSAASPDDVITTLNLPLVGVLEMLHSYAASVPDVVRPLLDVLVGVMSRWQDAHVDGLFVRRTAGELIWGYEDLLLRRLSLLLGSTFVPSSRMQLLRNESEEEVRNHKGFNLIDTGWRPAGRQAAESAAAAARTVAVTATAERMYGSLHGDAAPVAGAGSGGGNGASGSGTGGGGAAAAGLGGRRGGGNARLGLRRGPEYDEQHIWNMEMESGWSEVTSWGPNCTEPVRGTDAFQFRPGLDRDSVLRVWIAELFRSAQLLHVADEELHGIRLLRFVPDPAEAEPDPCHHQFIRGLGNVTVPMAVGPNGNGSSEAAHGVPILMSLPHYCLVDESVSAALDGMSCDVYKHGIFLDVEPTSGITMRAAKRLQLSSQITASARATLEPSIGASLILPIFWAEEASEISAVQAATFRGGVYRAQRVAATLRAVSYPAPAALAALAGMAALVAARPRRQTARVAAPSHHDHDDASGNANGSGGAAASATERLWAGSSSGAPVAAPPTPTPAPAPAVVTAGGGVNAGAGFGAGLLAPYPAMPNTADERTLQLLDEEDEDGEGEGEGEG